MTKKQLITRLKELKIDWDIALKEDMVQNKMIAKATIFCDVRDYLASIDKQYLSEEAYNDIVDIIRVITR